MKLLVLGLVSLILPVHIGSVHAQERPKYVPNEVLVRFKPGAGPTRRLAVSSRLGATLKSTVRLPRTYRYRVESMSVEAAVEAFRRSPDVDRAEPNYLYAPVAAPNDPQFPLQYALRNTGQTGGKPGADIGAWRAWDVDTGSSSIRVGIIDTGVDINHVDLMGNIWTNPDEIAGNHLDDDGNGYDDDVHGWDFVDEDGDGIGDADPTNPGFEVEGYHGTQVAGIVGAVGNNSLGVAGVCWNVSLVPLKVTGDHTEGSVIDTDSAIEAIDYAIREEVHILNLSWGGDFPSDFLRAKIQSADSAGIIVVCGAGNRFRNNDVMPFYPASYDVPNVVSVAASDHDDLRTGFTSWGPTSVDLAAPGNLIRTTMLDDTYGDAGGTSMAAPQVSGAFALLLSREPALSVGEAIGRIYQYVDPIPAWNGLTVTGGRLNIGRVLLGPDTIPPDPVVSLASHRLSSSWVEVEWAAPEDNGFTQRADSFDVRYSTSPINEANFAAATPVTGLPDPAAAGTLQIARVPGLAFTTTYYVALKSIDEAGNVSALSNVVSLSTLGPPAAAEAPNPVSGVTLLPGAQTDVPFVLWNSAGGGLDYSFASPGAPWATLIFGIGSPSQGTLFQGDSLSLSVRLDATDLPAGPASTEFVITTNDPLRPTIIVDVELTVTSAPDFSAVPDTLDHGIVFLGQSQVRNFQITNRGTEILTMSGMSTDHPDYSVGIGGLSLAPGVTSSIPIIYTPSSTQPSSATLSFLTNDPDEQLVYLPIRGRGIAAPTLAPLAVADTLSIPDRSSHVLTLTNPSTEPIAYRVVAAGSTRSLSGEAQPQPLPDLTGIRLLYHDRHSAQNVTTYITLVTDLLSRGAEIVQTSLPVSAEVLREADVFWLSLPDTIWSASERAALVEWMENGGTLLLSANLSLTTANQLLADLSANLSYATDFGAGGLVDRFGTHDITQGLDTLQTGFTASYFSSVAFPSATLARDGGDRPIAAYAEIGNGRLVAVAGDYFAGGLAQGDNFDFTRRIFGWLADGTWLAANPRTGNVAPQSAVNLNVTLDAHRLHDGDPTKDLLVQVTSPDTLDFLVPATLRAVGAPNLTADPDTVDFGLVFLGYPQTQTVTIGNDGSGRLEITSAQVDNPQYSLGPVESQLWPTAGDSIAVTLTAAQVGQQTATLTLDGNDPTPVTLLAEVAEPPIVAVTPSSIVDTLVAGLSASHALSIANQGPSDLHWSIELLSTLETPPAPLAKGTKATTQVDLSGLRVLHDETHGQQSLLARSYAMGTVSSLGGTVDSGNEPLTPEQLSGYDVLWLTNLTSPLNAAEEDAVVGWVRSGGSLLFEGDTDPTVTVLNSLHARLATGITLDPLDGTGGEVTVFVPHPTTVGISELTLATPLARISAASAPAGELFRDAGGAIHAAFSQVGAGRVMTLTSGSFADGPINESDNLDFCMQSLEWLGVLDWIQFSASSGTVPGGNAAQVDVMLDADRVMPGRLAVNIVVASNDPVTPTVSIPVTLEVLAAPDLQSLLSSIPFGLVFVGDTSTLPVPVTNIGSSTLEVTMASVAHPWFTVAPTSFALAPRETLEVLVSFHPDAVGTVNTALAFDSNDPVPTMVPITAQAATAPDIEVNTAPLTLALNPGAYASLPLVVGNTGGSNLAWTSAFSSAQDTLLGAPMRILRDRAHGQIDVPGNYTSITNDLLERGAQITINESSTITPALLAPYDVFWSTGADVANFTPSERTALRDWVLAGGGLFLHNLAAADAPGLEEAEIARQSFFQSILASLGAGIQYGIQDLVSGQATSIAQHRTTLNVTQAQIANAWARLDVVTAPASPLFYRPDAEASPVPVAAISSVQAGRAVAVATDFLHNSRITAAQNRRLSNQLFDWLAGGKWMAAYRGSGTVAAGGSMTIQVGFFSEGLAGGDHHATLTISSNDPDEPQKAVPVVLHVNGTPDIQAPALVQFGTVYTGSWKAKQITISNVGSAVLDLTSLTFTDYFTWGGPGSFQPVSIPAGGNYTFTAIFTPVYVGMHYGTITVASNDPDEASLVINVQGKGLQGPNFGMEAGSGEVVLRNQGPGELQWKLLADRSVIPPQPGYTLSNGSTTKITALADAAADAGEGLRDLSHARVAWTGDPDAGAVLANDLTARGATLVEIKRPIPSRDVLDGEHVLWIRSGEALAPYEREVLEGWVRDGGSLMIEGDWPAEQAVAPPEKVMPSGVGWEFPRIVTPLREAAHGFGRWMELGAGAIVQLEPGAEGDGAFRTREARLAGNLAVDWLVPPDWLTLEVESGTIAADGTVRVRVHEGRRAFDSGEHDVEIVAFSNDPDRPRLSTRVRLGPESSTRPVQHALRQSVPNPMAASSRIAFDLPVEERVELDVFDVNGRSVRTLLRGALPAGRHHVEWNGRGTHGARVSPGVYFYRITTPSFRAVKRLVVAP